MEQPLHKQAAGPFMVGVESLVESREPNRSVLLRPYGALFALHENDKQIFTCSASGSRIYEVGALDILMDINFKILQSKYFNGSWYFDGY